MILAPARARCAALLCLSVFCALAWRGTDGSVVPCGAGGSMPAAHELAPALGPRDGVNDDVAPAAAVGGDRHRKDLTGAQRHRLRSSIVDGLVDGEGVRQPEPARGFQPGLVVVVDGLGAGVACHRPIQNGPKVGPRYVYVCAFCY